MAQPKWILISENYMPDTADSRKDSGLTYIKMYREDVVLKLLADLERISDIRSAMVDTRMHVSYRDYELRRIAREAVESFNAPS